VFIADLSHCTDNAAMIALTGALHTERAQPATADFPVRARWSLTEEGAQA
ncbi:tRNA (adenosine(37)-N6)-threonylcarbamoyltransferase complex transferase subunit TsaD, partial [Acidithiobacillus sp. MC6.1]|nr:tRNA (adenosine(37)-N6)-threonylcarbamoyltransferase complex transferase subunit TsaD [Acidithiobacillus sp. MC6.1]